MIPAEEPKRTSWLDLITSSTKELESPERFFWWSGLAAISAIVKKSVWLDRYSYVLYPNIYVVLVSARSGLRKGIPVMYAKSIVEKVGNARIVAGRNSVQSVIMQLSKQETLPTGGVVSDAQAFLCAPELDAFLVKDEQALSILTDLYNTYEHGDKWKNSLKNSPVESLKNPCITLLGASNEALFDNVIQHKDMEGGFIARTFIIHESKRRTKNSLMFPPTGLISRSELADKIAYVKEAKGPFKITPMIRHQYDQWYDSLEEIDDRTGTMERIGDHVLKVAMLISLSKDLSLEIGKDDLEEAIERCTGFLQGTRKISMTQGRSEIVSFVGMVLKLLLESPDNEIERQRALLKLHGNVDAMMFDKVMDDLGDRGQGSVIAFRRQGKIFYKLKEEIVDRYRTMGGRI